MSEPPPPSSQPKRLAKSQLSNASQHKRSNTSTPSTIAAEDKTEYVFPIHQLCEDIKASMVRSGDSQNYTVTPAAGVYLSQVLTYLTQEVLNLTCGVLSIEQLNKLKTLSLQLPQDDQDEGGDESIDEDDEGEDGDDDEQLFRDNQNQRLFEDELQNPSNRLTITPEILEFIFQFDSDLKNIYNAQERSNELKESGRTESDQQTKDEERKDDQTQIPPLKQSKQSKEAEPNEASR